MKKKLLSVFLAFCMICSFLPATALAATPADNQIKLELVKDRTTFSGKDVLRVDFKYKSGTDKPDNQAIYLKVDAAKLDIINVNSGNPAKDAVLATFDVDRSSVLVKNPYVYYDDALEANVNSEQIVYARKVGDVLYLQWKVTEKGTPPAFADFTCISSIFFGLKDGITFDQLPKDIIKLATVAEDSTVTAQTNSIAVTVNGSTTMMYGSKDTSLNTLTVDLDKLFVPGEGVTFAEPAKPELKGSVTIDKTSPKFNDKLTAQTGSLDFNGAASGTLTYQWYRGTEKIIGADKATYTTVDADVNNPIKVEVMNSNNSKSVFSKETNKVAKADAAAPSGLAEVSKTDTTITVTANAAWEYSIDNGSSWQDSNVFDGLTANTTYSQIVARVKVTDTHNASPACTAISVTTAKGGADDTLKGQLKATHTPYTGTYDGKAHPAFTADMSSMTGWTATYSRTETGPYNTTMPQVTNVADSGTIYVKFANTSYADVIVEYDVAVSKAPLTVTAKPHTITYGDAPANNGVNITGFVNSETDTVLTGTLGYDYDYTQYGNVGEYTITPKGYTSTNYDITYKNGKLTVGQKEVSLTWNNHTGRVWGDGKTVTATATGMVNSDAISVTVTGGDATAVGNHTATAAGLTGEKAGNYKLPTAKTQAYTIGKATVTGTFTANFDVFYSDTAAKTVAVNDFTGLPSGIENAKFKGTAGSMTGTNSIIEAYTNESFTLKSGLVAADKDKTASWTVTIESDNYDDITATVNVKVIDKTDANVTITGAPTNKTYGDADFTLTASAADVGTGTGTWTWTSSDPSVLKVTGSDATATVKILKAGAATISAKFESGTTVDTKTTATITVGKATITVAAKDQSIYVNGTAPDLSAPVENTHYTVTGLVGSDTLVGTITMKYQKSGTAATPDVTKAGTYDIVISGVTEPTGGNYNAIVFKTATLTISNPSYSGGGSYTPTYAITVDKAANGTVTAAPGTAKTGDTVTLTATPDKGYELDTIKALDKDGKELKLTDQGNGKYTFTMPAGKVTVKAAFEDSNLVKFDDVSKGDYCYEAVKWAVKNGITSGIGNNRFGPNDPCTRGQIVTFLWRAAGSPEPKSMSSFSDVPADSYYAKAVAWAVEKGITSGTGDGKFSPEDPCTRAQSVTFLYRAAGSPAVIGSAEFSDVESDTYYAAAVAWAAKNGITSGTGGGQFGSDDECSRGHIVTFLFNAYGK